MVDNSLITANINALGEGVIHPSGEKNFTQVNENRVNSLANSGKEILPYIKQYIEFPKTFDGLLEALFVVDKLADNKVEGVENLYPALSKYNNSDCPEIQTMLSGIYRKILVPDAFGPLCRMFHKQISAPPKGFFDASEETGGAILEYLKSYGAIKAYPIEVNKSVQSNKNTKTVQNQPLISNYSINPYSKNGLRI